MFRMAFVQVAEFDWVTRATKRVNLRKMIKNLLLWLYLANSQVSVYRTIGPLVLIHSVITENNSIFHILDVSCQDGKVCDKN